MNPTKTGRERMCFVSVGSYSSISDIRRVTQVTNPYSVTVINTW